MTRAPPTRRRITRLQAVLVILIGVVIVAAVHLRSIAVRLLWLPAYPGSQATRTMYRPLRVDIDLMVGTHSHCNCDHLQDTAARDNKASRLVAGRNSAAKLKSAFAPGSTVGTGQGSGTWELGDMGPFAEEPVDASSPASDHLRPKVVVDRGAVRGGDGAPGGDARTAFPRVALLFLSRGPMPLESSWSLFFQAAGKLTQGWPEPRRPSRHVVPGQQLFTAYLHAAPGYRHPAGTLFSKLQIDDPVQVRWGQHSVAEAERRLFIASLHDRSNARFALLSESCMFLHPPAVVFLEALAENRSRINACAWPVKGDYKRRNTHRLHPDMHTDKLTPATWRKSSQWKLLNRRHAALVAGDDEINPAFVRECWVDGHHPPSRFCVSDEHYVPSLLAALGLQPFPPLDYPRMALDWRFGVRHVLQQAQCF